MEILRTEGRFPRVEISAFRAQNDSAIVEEMANGRREMVNGRWLAGSRRPETGVWKPETVSNHAKSQRLRENFYSFSNYPLRLGVFACDFRFPKSEFPFSRYDATNATKILRILENGELTIFPSSINHLPSTIFSLGVSASLRAIFDFRNPNFYSHATTQRTQRKYNGF